MATFTLRQKNSHKWFLLDWVRFRLKEGKCYVPAVMTTNLVNRRVKLVPLWETPCKYIGEDESSRDDHIFERPDGTRFAPNSELLGPVEVYWKIFPCSAAQPVIDKNPVVANDEWFVGSDTSSNDMSSSSSSSGGKRRARRTRRHRRR